MKHAFTVNFVAQNLFKSPECEVTQIIINDECIGYIAENTNPESPSSNPVVTPFNASGLMEESHCVGCAAERLFAEHSGVPISAIGISAEGQSSSPLAALLMAGVIGAALKR